MSTNWGLSSGPALLPYYKEKPMSLLWPLIFGIIFLIMKILASPLLDIDDSVKLYFAHGVLVVDMAANVRSIGAPFWRPLYSFGSYLEMATPSQESLNEAQPDMSSQDNPPFSIENADCEETTGSEDTRF